MAKICAKFQNIGIKLYEELWSRGTHRLYIEVEKKKTKKKKQTNKQNNN